MEDLIDYINRHVWVVIVFFLALFLITYGITRLLPIDRTKQDITQEVQNNDTQNNEKDNQNGEPTKEEEPEVTPEPTAEPTPAPEEKGVIYQETASTEQIVLRFAGDVNLADNYAPMEHASQVQGGVQACFGKKLLRLMQSADVMMVNHEYSCSDEGTPMAGKQYTFLAKEKNNKQLTKLGVDIVSLANNHVYDYGEEAFLNTLKSLDKYKIQRVGAGKNLAEAKKPVYYFMNGVKIAVVAATRAEKNVMTPQADKNSSGVFYTYDDEEFLKAIAKAKKKADYVIAYVHWGTEYSTSLESEQTQQAHDYIDSGADLVVGGHTHCLQGVEYYKGKPVIYSLGNFWFNDKTLDTGILEVQIDTSDRKEVEIKADGSKEHYDGVKNKDVKVTFYPCIQSGCRTILAPDEDENARILADLNNISINARFNKKGVLQKIR